MPGLLPYTSLVTVDPHTLMERISLSLLILGRLAHSLVDRHSQLIYSWIFIRAMANVYIKTTAQLTNTKVSWKEHTRRINAILHALCSANRKSSKRLLASRDYKIWIYMYECCNKMTAEFVHFRYYEHIVSIFYGYYNILQKQNQSTVQNWRAVWWSVH